MEKTKAVALGVARHSVGTSTVKQPPDFANAKLLHCAKIVRAPTTLTCRNLFQLNNLHLIKALCHTTSGRGGPLEP